MFKRRFITLLEVVIAFTLFSILIGSLLYYLKSSTIVSYKIERMKRKTTSKWDCYQQLHAIFTKLILIDEDDRFYLEEMEENPTHILHFTFENQTEKQPQFSGKQHGKLWLNAAGELIFHMETLDGEHMREKALISNINSLNFTFFRRGTDWFEETSQWEKEDQKIPHMLILRTIQEDESIAFPFFIKFESQGLEYPE